MGLRDTEPAGALAGARVSQHQCSPGCRHSLCKGPGTSPLSLQQPKPGSIIYKSIYLILGCSTVSGTPARPERCTVHTSLASRFERKAWKYEPKTPGVQGYFCKWDHLQGYPRADGRHPPSPSLPMGYMQCAQAPVCGHVCDLTLFVSPPPTQASYSELPQHWESLVGSMKGTQSPRLFPGTDFESRKPVCPAFPGSQLLNRWVSIPLPCLGQETPAQSAFCVGET